MPYRYFEDAATAGAAFEAWGESVEEMFVAAAEATLNVMAENLGAIDSKEQRNISVADEALDLVLFRFLNELVFYKDAEELLLRVKNLQVKNDDGRYSCSAEVCGETIDVDKHQLNADIKAVMFHRLEVKETRRGWEVTVALDV